jgi:hypothetical protein
MQQVAPFQHFLAEAVLQTAHEGPRHAVKYKGVPARGALQAGCIYMQQVVSGCTAALNMREHGMQPKWALCQHEGCM